MRAAVIACLSLIPATALAQGRILIETASEAPDLYPEQSVLYVKRYNAVVGDCDQPVDAGIDAPADADMDADADADMDAAAAADAGADVDAAVDADGGASPDAGGCTVVPGDAVTMVVQPRFTTGPDGTRFTLLLATPAPPLYSVEPSWLFDELAALTAPRVEHVRVEYEDPALGHRCIGANGCGGDVQGCGVPYDDEPYWEPPDVPDGGFGDGGVDVIPVGEYEVLRLSVADTTALAAWLDQYSYAYTQEDLDAIGPYIARGDTITAVRISVDASEDGALSPLALTWPGRDVRVPLALARPPAGTFSELTVYVSADGRYQLPDARIAFAARTRSTEPSFLTRNDLVVGADRTINRDPLAARISGDPELIPVTTIEDRIPVPVRVDCESRDRGCCSDCNASGHHRIRWDFVFITASALFVLRRRRKQR